jgi:glutathionyl-hydroquinone reductase
MFYFEFDDLLPEKYKNLNLLPDHLRKQIEETNDWVYNDVNNGVYKSGFATYVKDITRNRNGFADLFTEHKRPTRKLFIRSSTLSTV